MPVQDTHSPDSGAERLVAGRYRLHSVLGRGGMGTVWHARDEMLHRSVAIKEVHASVGLPAERRSRVYARLEREAWAAARVNAPGVVTVHDVLTFDGQPWIVMELVRGRSLAEAISANGAMPPRDVARIGIEVLAALCAAHDAGVLHRDVKPANVLLAHTGRVVLTDFGIATVEGDTALTMTGELVGSPEFLAPERALGQAPGSASDLWSLGALLYTAVQGRSPFRRATPLATLRAVVDDELPPPHRAGPLRTVIEGLLRKDPAQRMTHDEAGRELRRVAELASAGHESAAMDDTTSSVTSRVGPNVSFDTATETVTTSDESPTVVSPKGDAPTADRESTTTVSMLGTSRTGAATQQLETDEAPTAPASAATAAEAVRLAPYAEGPHVESAAAEGTPGIGHDNATGPVRHGRRRTAYLAGTAAVLTLLGATLTYVSVGEGGHGDGDGTGSSQPVSVEVTGGATTYAGSCPPETDQAPWFTATFTAARPPLQFSYRWVSENGAVVDRRWRTLSFREGEPTTKTETVRLSTYAREGTLRSAMAVEIRSPFDARSTSVPFSLTCRPAGE
ncbi:serine/threonine-protein kinase [Streptomyces werraensis]|uniref:non-specific serine/threonine protein kinase n=1 Tax=Streptomyces werraensis TaxID=68284 RepID=A0ABV3JMQ5_9ACTN